MDPGTTTAVAVIDLKGRLLLLWSMKHATQAAVSRMIIDCGRPVVIAGDVNPPPALLEKIASGFSSKLFYPESNMTIAEKLKIAEKYSKHASRRESAGRRPAAGRRKLWKNKHERDALAAALRAWKRIRHIIDRAYGSTEGMEESAVEKVMLCVLHEGRSIEECKRRFLRPLVVS